MDGTLAQVLLFAGNFAPRNWAFCQGQLLSIAQNTALFSILGTMYGGDGRTTFALPDFQGRIAVGAGNGPGLPNYEVGEKSGFETTTINTFNLPAHSHVAMASVAVSTGNGSLDEANTNIYASTGSSNYASPASGNSALGDVSATVDPNGGNQPISIMEPSLGMNFVICMQGVFPSRN